MTKTTHQDDAHDALARPGGDGDRPERPRHRAILHKFDVFAGRATAWAGSPLAFGMAVAVVVIWAVSGPAFGYSETWQLVINTGTTVVTFVMVFLIQQSQNKDSMAVHLKLNELIASHRMASNRLVSVEDLDEEELRRLIVFYRQLAKLAAKDGTLKATHSLDEADGNHEKKLEARGLDDAREGEGNDEGHHGSKDTAIRGKHQAER
jgi:low affinity Fe/Cu permease